MRLLIIGQSVLDKIKDGNILKIRPGGIFYSVISLYSFLEKDDKLFLSTTVDKSNYDFFSFIYDKIEREYIRDSERIPVVNLIIDRAGEREEFYENISKGIDIEFADLNRFDGILVNMITGFDISIDQMEMLREYYDGTIYLDVHTLSRGVDKNRKRIFRTIPEFGKWAVCIDILQANNNEIKTLSSKKNELEIVKELLDFGIKQVIITKESKGSDLYYMKDGKLMTIFQNALQLHPVNKVGCGDVFGAVYFYNYIRNKNVSDALLLASTAAGISTSYPEVRDLLNLKKDVRKQLN